MRQRRRRIPNRWQPLLGCAPVRSRACGDCAHTGTLRRQARTKFGEAAAEMFFTRAGLEQATRPEVADHHASRFVEAGVRRVLDLGCGIGSDSMAFARAGLEVVAVDVDPTTAAVAQANLAGCGEVICADASDVAEQLMTAGVGVFCDPARRDDRGRVWRVEDFTPAWSTVMELLDGGRTAGVKLGPALPHSLIPEVVDGASGSPIVARRSSHALGGHGRDSGTALRTDHAERATDRDGRAAAARTRPGSLSLRTGRRCHPRWRHRRAGRSAWCGATRPAGRIPDG